MNIVRRRRTLVFAIVLGLSGLGAWVTGDLLRTSANLWHAEPAQSAIMGQLCQAAERVGFTCAAASQSAWNSFDLPLPVLAAWNDLSVLHVDVPAAFVGLAYFVFLGVWFAMVGNLGQSHGRLRSLPLVAGVCGGALSLYFVVTALAGESPRSLQIFLAHGINCCLALGIWRLHRLDRPATDFAQTLGDIEHQTSRRAARSAIAIAIASVAIAGLWMYQTERRAIQDRIDRLLPFRSMVMGIREDPEFLLREHYAQPRFDIPVRETETLTTNQPELVVFTDFQCPSCYCNAVAIRNRISEEFVEGLTVRVRHFPLGTDCNEFVKTDLHASACAAAFATEAARRLGGESAFWEMHDLVYANRKSLGERTFAALAQKLGFDSMTFLQEMASAAVREVVQADIALAHTIGVNATPTMFVNGRRVTKLCQTSVFWTALAQAEDMTDESQISQASSTSGLPMASARGVKPTEQP